MRIILWASGAVLLAVTAFGLYMAAQSPTFVAGLSALAAAAVWKAIKPAITKPMSEDEAKARDAATRQGRDDERVRKKLGSLRPDR